MRSYLDFEKPVAELEAKVDELRALHSDGDAIGEEINRIEGKAAVTLKELYAGLTPWQKTQVARHPLRPHCLDYISALTTDFVPLAGDRKHGEDAAIVGGFGRFRGDSVCVIGHEKGSDTDGRLKHNFGMARPEGYRKAVRLMGMADHFDVPVIALIDTAVPVWALDADTVNGPLGIRVSRAAERLGRDPEGPSLGEGRLVVADADSPLAILFGEPAPGHEPTAHTRRLALFAVQVAGVPALHAEETLWACRSALAQADG